MQDSTDDPTVLVVGSAGGISRAGKAPAVWPIVVVALVTIAVIVGVAGWLLREQEETNRRELESALTATHLNTVSALSSWLARVEQEVRSISQVPAVNSAVREVVSYGPGGGDGPTNIVGPALRLNTAILLHDQVDATSEFVVLGLDNIVLVSEDDEKVGRTLDDLSPDLISAARASSRLLAFEAPRSSDGPGQRVHSTLDIAAAVQHPDGAIEAILVVRFDEGEFTEILQRGRIGESGETYAINSGGELISHSRFDEQLFSIGLAASGDRGLMKVSIRDPGGDMTHGFVPGVERDQQPLTKMAQSVLSGSSDLDLDSYRDYRGVPVVGIWTWDAGHAIGIATEIDADEAFLPFRQARLSSLLGTSITILLLVGMVAIFLQNRRKTAAEEARFRSLFEDSPVSVWEQDNSRVRIALDEIIQSGVTDLRAHFRKHPGLALELADLIRVIDVNQATLDLYGVSTKEELMGSLELVFGEASEPELIEQLVELAGGHHRYEAEVVLYRSNGEAGMALVVVSIAPGSEKSWSKVFVSVIDITARKEIERRFRSLFEDSPLSVWEEDYSQVRIALDEIMQSGVTDLRTHFRDHPGLATELGGMIQVVNVNQATVDLYRAESKDELLGSLELVFGEASEPELIEQLVTLAEGHGSFESETTFFRLDGQTGACIVSGLVAPGSEESWSSVYVSVVDITDRKEMETLVNARTQELETKNLELESLSAKLSKYLSPQVYSSIFTGEQSVEIASQRKKLTVFFSDIASFTETTDNMESEELTNLLNRYLTEMSKIALEHGATIDKYVGDAILAFFGDPETRGVKEDAKACVLMAIAMQGRMRDLDHEWRNRGLDRPFRIRVGINTGFCTVGNFGSKDRMDYTIIGNEVNLSSRLESSSELGGILMSHQTYSLVKDVVAAEEQEPLMVKGFAKPIRNYKVVGAYDELVEEGRLFRKEKHGVRLEVNWERQDRAAAIETVEEFLSELKG